MAFFRVAFTFNFVLSVGFPGNKVQHRSQLRNYIFMQLCLTSLTSSYLARPARILYFIYIFM